MPIDRVRFRAGDQPEEQDGIATSTNMQPTKPAWPAVLRNKISMRLPRNFKAAFESAL